MQGNAYSGKEVSSIRTPLSMEREKESEEKGK